MRPIKRLTASRGPLLHHSLFGHGCTHLNTFIFQSLLLDAERHKAARLSAIHSFILSCHCLLGLPRGLLPFTFSWMMFFDSALLLIRCPKNFSFLVLIMSISRDDGTQNMNFSAQNNDGIFAIGKKGAWPPSPIWFF